MLKRFTLNRFLIGALAVCVLIVGGSFLYMQHAKSEADRVKAEIQAAEQARAERLRQQQHTGSRPMDVGDAAPGLDAEAASSVSTDTDAARPSETDAEVLEGIELSETDTGAADEPAEGVEVSPFGFGPYPEVPPEFPITFPMSDPDDELLARVLIKLHNQGVNVQTVTMHEDGLIYPIIPGTVLVRWDEYEGPRGTVRYISSRSATYEDGQRLDAISREKGRSLREEDIPPDLKLVPFEGNGIEPYSFLGLKRK